MHDRNTLGICTLFPTGGLPPVITLIFCSCFWKVPSCGGLLCRHYVWSTASCWTFSRPQHNWEQARERMTQCGKQFKQCCTFCTAPSLLLQRNIKVIYCYKRWWNPRYVKGTVFKRSLLKIHVLNKCIFNKSILIKQYLLYVFNKFIFITTLIQIVTSTYRYGKGQPKGSCPFLVRSHTTKSFIGNNLSEEGRIL